MTMSRLGFVVVLVVASFMPSALPGSNAVAAGNCTVAPVLRDSAVNQGVAGQTGYSQLARGKDAFVRFYLSGPSCSSSQLQLLGATLKVTVGAAVTNVSPVNPIAATANGDYPVIAGYSAAPVATDAPGDPEFMVPGNVLLSADPSATFSATFTLTGSFRVGSTGSATAFGPVSTTISFDKRSRALRLLVVKLGDPNGFADCANLPSTCVVYPAGQHPEFGTVAVQTTINAMKSLSRTMALPGAPSATTAPTGDLGGTSGGLRYSFNVVSSCDPSLVTCGMVNLHALSDTSGPLLSSTRKFCGTGVNFTDIQAQLTTLLNVWNTNNPNATADKVVGVVDSSVSDGIAQGCALGIGAVGGTQAWVRIDPSDSKNASVLSMEIAHLLGIVPASRSRTTSKYHSPNTEVDQYVNSKGQVVDTQRAVNLTTHSYMANDRTVMYGAAADANWTDGNTLFEAADFALNRCQMGGSITADCSGTVGTSDGVPLGPNFTIAGAVAPTAGKADVAQSYFTLQTRYPIPPGVVSAYHLVQRQGTSIRRDDQIPVQCELSEHESLEGGTGVGTCYFQAAVPFDTSSDRVELWRGAPPAATACAAAGTSVGGSDCLYARHRNDPPVTNTSVGVSRGASTVIARAPAGFLIGDIALSQDGEWVGWVETPDDTPDPPVAYVAPRGNPDARTLLPLPAGVSGIGNLAWRPDGGALAVIGEGRVFVLPVTLGTTAVFGAPLEIYDGGSGATDQAEGRLSWSPDGTRIVFGTADQQLDIVDADGSDKSSPTVLLDRATIGAQTGDTFTHMGNPSWSQTPGNDRISFSVDRQPTGYPDRVFASTAALGSVVVIDPSMPACCETTIPNMPNADRAVASVNSSKLYFGEGQAGQIQTVDPLTRTVTGTIPLARAQVADMAIVSTPALPTPRLYVLHPAVNEFSVYNTATDTQVGPSIHMDAAPTAVTSGPPLTPDVNPWVWVALGGCACIEGINPATNALTGFIPIGFPPGGIASDARYLYITQLANPGVDGYLVVYDPNAPSGSRILRRIEVGMAPMAVRVGRDGTAYVMNQDSNTLSIISNPTSATPTVRTVPVAAGPGRLALSPDEAHAYVSSYDGAPVHRLSVVDTATATLVRTISFTALGGVAALVAAPEPPPPPIPEIWTVVPAQPSSAVKAAEGYLPSWGPDGRVAYASYASVGINLVPLNLDGSPDAASDTEVTPEGNVPSYVDGLLGFKRPNPITANDELLVESIGRKIRATVHAPVGVDPADYGLELFYSCGGVNYPVAVNVNPTSTDATTASFEVTIDTSFGCGGGTLKMYLDDGFSRFDVTDSLPQSVQTNGLDQEPAAEIDSPTPGSHFTQFRGIPLRGAAKDPEDGELAGASLQWSVSGPTLANTSVGTGNVVDLPNAALPLPSAGWAVGTYTVTLTATDSAGHESVSTAEYTIDRDANDDWIVDGLYPCVSSTDSAAGVGDADADGIPNLDDAHPCAFDAPADSTPATITVTKSGSDLTVSTSDNVGLRSVTCSVDGSPVTLAHESELWAAETYVTTFTVSDPGTHAIECSASDLSYNRATASTTVTNGVSYQFLGFFSPVDNPPTVNTGSTGKTYPIKFQLKDASGRIVSDLATVTATRYRSVTCGSFSGTADALETTTTGNAGLRFDSVSQQFVYTWKTPSAKGCYVFSLLLADGSVREADFNLK